MRVRPLIAYGCTVCALWMQSTHAGAEPENGWWWNPAESGRGFFIETTSGVTYLAGYFYDGDGRATWLSSGGPNPDPYSYRGTLQSYRNGQTLFGPYTPPSSVIDVGPVEVTFTDDQHGTIQWPGGTVAIERQIFGSEEESPVTPWVLGLIDPPFKPETGWWWNDAESGRGYSIEVQGSHLFIVSFMYDDAGNPVWYFSAGPMSAPNRYDGDVLLLSGGQTLNGPYRAPTSTPIGRMTIDFVATDDATITFTDGASQKATRSHATLKRGSGNIRARVQIPRHIFGPEDQWPQWVGFARAALTEISEAGTTGTFTTHEKWIYDLQWIRKLDTPPRGALAWYTLASTSRVVYERSTDDTSNGCKGSTLESYGGLEGTLVINRNLTYGFEVRESSMVPATVYEHCDDGLGNVSDDQYQIFPIIILERPVAPALHIVGMNSYRLRTGLTPSPRMVGIHVNPTFRWEFVAGGSGP